MTRNRTLRMGLVPLMFLLSVPAARADGTRLASQAGADDVVAKTPVPGDFDVDFRPDLLFQTPRGNLLVVLMEGLKPTLRLATNPRRRPEEGWQAAGTYDFDGDGNTDILWFHPERSELALWYMEGRDLAYEGAFRNPIYDATPVSIFDFNHDRQADILIQTTQGDLLVLVLAGTDVVTITPIDVPGTSPNGDWVAVGTGDFNGDGETDVVFQHRDLDSCGPALACETAGFDRVAIALVTGTTGRLVDIAGLKGRTWRIGAVADFDGLPGPDLILHDTVTGETAAWLMEGLKPRQSVVLGLTVPGSLVGPR
jgi:hypothetical protein